MILALGLVLALLWREVFSLESIMEGVPALGAAVFTLCAWAAALMAMGRRARWTKANIYASVCILALGVSCAFQPDHIIRLLSFLVILAGSVLAYLALSGVERCAITDARILPDAFVDTFRGLFKNWGAPFRAVGALAPGDKKSLGGVALGVLIAAPILIIVISGLSSADAVFDSVFSGAVDWLESLDIFTTIWRALWTVLLALAFFSALYFLRHQPQRLESDTEPLRLPVSALITVLALLVLICGVFAAIQFRYLFGGEEAAAMSGGWAEYARSGFFVLIRVAAVVCCAARGCSRASRENVAARVLSVVLVLLALVMLASAAYRLHLYVSAYGLSVTRVMAVWAIAAVGVCLVLGGVKSLPSTFRFWPWAAAIVLAMWTLFSFVNVHALVARHNVAAYLDGRLETVDVEYLKYLSPSALEPLYDLRAAVENGEAGSELSVPLDDAIEWLENWEARRWTAIVLR